MGNLENALSAMEIACESDEELVSYMPAQVESLIAAVKALPADEKAAVQDRLDRIATLIDGKMMLYGEELRAMSGQIRAVSAGNVATNRYRTVAVLPIRPHESDVKE